MTKYGESTKLRVKGKSSAQCIYHWLTTPHINPRLSKEPWSDAEDNLLMSLFEKLGSRWKKFEMRLKGRSNKQIQIRKIIPVQ